MTRPTAIILGGYDKHCDFTPMVQEMLASPYIKEAVLIGATADQIERTCRENGYTHLHRAGTLKDAIEMCIRDRRTCIRNCWYASESG